MDCEGLYDVINPQVSEGIHELSGTNSNFNEKDTKGIGRFLASREEVFHRVYLKIFNDASSEKGFEGFKNDPKQTDYGSHHDVTTSYTLEKT